MDSFDHYATADITEKWTSILNGSPTIGAYGRNSTNGLRLGSGATSNVSATVLGVAVNVTTHDGASRVALISLGSSGSWECGLALNPDLTLQPFISTHATLFAPGGNGYMTLLGSASPVPLQVGTWTYIELRMKCDNSAGTCVVRQNGIERLNLTGLDTMLTATALTRVALGAYGNLVIANIDDLVVMDLNGSVNNAFLGDVTISALYPNGVGTTSGWTPSAGSNYQNVDEATPNDDTDYNSASTLLAKDTYAMQNCMAGADIKAVQILAAVRKAQEGPGKIKLVTRSASTDYDGAEQSLGGTTYSYLREIREVDPATSQPWTESGWNAAEVGLKKTG
jgi:hypothetical protein